MLCGIGAAEAYEQEIAALHAHYKGKIEELSQQVKEKDTKLAASQQKQEEAQREQEATVQKHEAVAKTHELALNESKERELASEIARQDARDAQARAEADQHMRCAELQRSLDQAMLAIATHKARVRELEEEVMARNAPVEVELDAPPQPPLTILQRIGSGIIYSAQAVGSAGIATGETVHYGAYHVPLINTLVPSPTKIKDKR